MKPRRRKPSAPKVVNGYVGKSGTFHKWPPDLQFKKEPDGDGMSDLDREFGPWVRGPDGRLWRAKRL